MKISAAVVLVGLFFAAIASKSRGNTLDSNPGFSNGLIAHWSLDEASGARADSRGNYPFTEYGSVQSQAGKFAQAAAPGAGSSLRSSLNYGVIPHSFTITFWFRRTLVDDSWQFLLHQWAAGGWVCAEINPTTGNLTLSQVRNRIVFALGHDALDRVFSDPITDTNWHFIVFQWVEGSKLRVGVDNSFNETKASDFPENPPICTNTVAGLSIGKADTDSYVKHYAVDELCVWNRALSDSELGTLYDGGAGFDPVLGATVEIFSWKSLKGTYSGIFSYPQPPKLGTCGYVTLTATGTKRFSGNFYFGGSTSRFKGAFDSQGNSSVKVDTDSTGTLDLSLHISTKSGLSQITGTATGWYFASTPLLLSHEQKVPRATALPQAGDYNVTLVSGTDVQAAGIGLVRVQPRGTTELFLTLRDGNKIAEQGQISEANTWSFYKSLYSNSGALGGTLAFDAAASTCSGTVYWSKPPTKSLTYPAAISKVLTLSGTRQ